MTTQLSLYNQALFLLKERELSSIATGSNREASQKKLDVIWDAGALDYCLSRALWNFATRTVESTYDSGVTPAFGLKRAHAKPSDWIKTAAICTDEKFHYPCLDYRDKGEYWFSDYDTLYIEYVSNDSSYGGDLSLFPEDYEKFVASYLAKELAGNLTGDFNIDDIKSEYRIKLDEARTNDASNQPTKFPATGNWARARTSNRWRNR